MCIIGVNFMLTVLLFYCLSRVKNNNIVRKLIFLQVILNFRNIN